MPYKDPEKQREWYRENYAENRASICSKKRRIILTQKQKKRKAEKHKIWAVKNRVRRRAYAKKYIKDHPSYRLKSVKYLRERRKISPWLGHYDCAKTRCLNRKRQGYHRYGGRGIMFKLTHEIVKYLWIRDKAYLLKFPTLDRIDNDGNYQLDNCRFIEKSENSTKGNYEARWK